MACEDTKIKTKSRTTQGSVNAGNDSKAIKIVTILASAIITINIAIKIISLPTKAWFNGKKKVNFWFNMKKNHWKKYTEEYFILFNEKIGTQLCLFCEYSSAKSVSD